MDRLVLTGLEGVVEGERFEVDWGQTVLLGRSRACEISLRRCAKFRALSPTLRQTHKDVLSVSRRHARISFPDRHIVLVEDLSVNGTYVDGHKISSSIYLTDLREKTHELRIGNVDRFRLNVSANAESFSPGSPVSSIGST